MSLPAFFSKNPLSDVFSKLNDTASGFLDNILKFIGIGRPQSIVDRYRPIGGYADERAGGQPQPQPQPQQPAPRPGSKGMPLPPVNLQWVVRLTSDLCLILSQVGRWT